MCLKAQPARLGEIRAQLLRLGDIAACLHGRGCTVVLATDCCRDPMPDATGESPFHHSAAGLQADQCAIFATSHQSLAFELPNGGGFLTKAFVDALDDPRATGIDHRNFAGLLRNRVLTDVRAYRQVQVGHSGAVLPSNSKRRDFRVP